MEINSSRGDNVFVSWSGGKDAYLSLLLAKERDLEIVCLLSFISAEGESRSHGLQTAVLKQQAEALGLPLVTETVSWESYERGFEQSVTRIKAQYGVTGGVFGDINLAEHRDWIKKTSERSVINYNLPLWQMEENEVLEELLTRGCKVLVVAIRSDLVDQRWLGRIIDREYIEYCVSKGISPCGENGEFHTLVIDGPLFNRPLHYKPGEIKSKDKQALLEILV